jgi:hypothetical protein
MVSIKDEEAVMFEYSRAMTSFSVDDVDTAAEFYRKQLGVEFTVPVSPEPSGLHVSTRSRSASTSMS